MQIQKGLHVSELPDKKNSVSKNVTAGRLINCSLISSEQYLSCDNDNTLQAPNLIVKIGCFSRHMCVF